MCVLSVLSFISSSVWFLIVLLSHLVFYTDVVAEGIACSVFCFGDGRVSFDCRTGGVVVVAFDGGTECVVFV